jgi:hypothetical protein
MDEIETWLWPDVSNRRQIHFAILEDYWASLIAAAIAFLSALFRYLMPQQMDALTILADITYISIFIGLAFGIERRSRAAAVAALSLYVLDYLFILIQHGPRGIIFVVFIVVALINAVRATFAYQKLPVPPPGTPTLEESFAAFRNVPIPKDPTSTPE